MGIGSAGRHSSQVRAARLLRSKKHRAEQRCFLVEGPALVEAAHAAGARLHSAFVAQDAPTEVIDLAGRLAGAGVPVTTVSAATIEALSDTRAPQPIVAVAPFLERPFDQLAAIVPGDRAALVLVLHDLGDPGNVGTLIRCAEAFRASAVCCGPQCAEPYNSKVVRATAGALFRVPLVRYAQWETLAAILAARSVQIIAADAGGTDISVAALPARCALAIGHERHGLAETIKHDVAARVAVPLIADVDSLNAGVAGAILMYEIARKLKLVGSS